MNQILDVCKIDNNIFERNHFFTYFYTVKKRKNFSHFYTDLIIERRRMTTRTSYLQGTPPVGLGRLLDGATPEESGLLLPVVQGRPVLGLEGLEAGR